MGALAETTKKGRPTETAMTAKSQGIGLAPGRRNLRHAQGNRENQQRQPENHQVQPGLPPRAQDPRGKMGVKISAQEHRLVEHHAGVPYRGRPAQAGKHHLGEHRLDEEQQRGADKKRKGEQRLHPQKTSRGRIGCPRPGRESLFQRRPPRRSHQAG